MFCRMEIWTCNRWKHGQRLIIGFQWRLGCGGPTMGQCCACLSSPTSIFPPRQGSKRIISNSQRRRVVVVVMFSYLIQFLVVLWFLFGQLFRHVLEECWHMDLPDERADWSFLTKFASTKNVAESSSEIAAKQTVDACGKETKKTIRDQIANWLLMSLVFVYRNPDVAVRAAGVN